MEYPKTDEEIRMYCLNLSMGVAIGAHPDIEEAKRIYKFITASRQAESRKKSRCPLLSRLKNLFRPSR